MELAEEGQRVSVFGLQQMRSDQSVWAIAQVDGRPTVFRIGGEKLSEVVASEAAAVFESRDTLQAIGESEGGRVWIGALSSTISCWE